MIFSGGLPILKASAGVADAFGAERRQRATKGRRKTANSKGMSVRVEAVVQAFCRLKLKGISLALLGSEKGTP